MHVSIFSIKLHKYCITLTKNKNKNKQTLLTIYHLNETSHCQFVWILCLTQFMTTWQYVTRITIKLLLQSLKRR